MGDISYTLVSLAPVGKFECLCCFFDKEEAAVLITSMPVCVECVKDVIIPRFFTALEQEFNYPVEWSPGKPLKPEDFAAFFDDYLRFIENWAEKESEYKTRGPDRLYCRNLNERSGKQCEAFLGDRTTFLFDIVFCRSCDEWVCKRCGVKNEKHECKADGDESEKIEGLEGTKRCPSCKRLVELQDGCNLVRCEGPCGTEYCYICLTVRPPKEHFSRGMPCPKFGNPGDEEVLFAEDVIEDDGEEDERRNIVFWGINAHMETVLLSALRPDGSVAMGPEQVPLAIADINLGPGVLLDVHRQIMRQVTDLPQLRASQRRIVAEHREHMQGVLDNREVVEDWFREEGLLTTQPVLAQRLQDAAALMISNLDLYVEFDGVQSAYADFQRRHEQIMAFIGQHLNADTFNFWPRMHSIFSVYRLVAPDRMAAAAPRLEGGIEGSNGGDAMDIDTVLEEGEIREDGGAEGESAARE